MVGRCLSSYGVAHLHSNYSCFVDQFTASLGIVFNLASCFKFAPTTAAAPCFIATLVASEHCQFERVFAMGAKHPKASPAAVARLPDTHPFVTYPMSTMSYYFSQLPGLIGSFPGSFLVAPGNLSNFLYQSDASCFGLGPWWHVGSFKYPCFELQAKHGWHCANPHPQGISFMYYCYVTTIRCRGRSHTSQAASCLLMHSLLNYCWDCSA